MLKTFFLAIKLLWREWRRGEWFIVFFALILAISATTAIHFYTDRLLRGLEQQSAKFLGGNLAISSSTPIPHTWQQQAQRLQIRTAEVWAYPSVINAQNKMQLANVQAVSNSYPLIGDTAQRPQPHTVWAEPRLLPLLALNLNDTISIGAASFRITKILTADIDALNTGWAIAPRVMMRLDDVPATRTVLPGSRVDYRLLLVGNKNQLQQFQTWLAPQLQPGQRVLDVDTQPSALKDILQRVNHYLQLIILICLMMSGVAIALSTQQFLRRHYAHVALWRCLGAKKRQIMQIFLWQLIVIAVSAASMAIVIAFFAQILFANLFNYFVQFPLPSPSINPAFLGLVTCFFLLFAFSFPIINRLPNVSPLFMWRNEINVSSLPNTLFLILAWIVLLLFIYWLMDFSTLTLYFFNLVLLCIAFLYALSLLLLACLRKLLTLTQGAGRRGLSQLVQHPHSVSLQFIGFNLIFILLMVLGLIKTDLIKNWQHALPTMTPNYFAFNIAPTDLTPLQQLFKQQHIAIEGIYPMVRGRLITLNGKPILTAIPKDALTHNALHRELNLSWMWTFPSDNKIVSGHHWTSRDMGKAWVSVENNLAVNLQLHLGDELTFQIGAQTISAVIINFRSLEWSSFHPNFFIIFPPGLLTAFPTTYITSFHLQTNQTNLLNQLIQQFPNITIIDVANLLQQTQDLINKMALALQYLFAFALGTGVLIFIASLQASMDERRQTYALLHVLGASKKYIIKSIIVEFSCLFLLILLTSASFAWLITRLLERSIFNI